MIIKGGDYVPVASAEVQLKCPACGSIGMFRGVKDVQDIYQVTSGRIMAQRICPNRVCKAHVFCVVKDSVVIKMYPVSPVEFNKNSIPDRISAALSEAVVCHAEGLYVAAAIMIRRTLEELCEDKVCKGSNLSQRVKELEKCITIPVDLIPALDELRLLGNDAAHIEAKTYDSIGKDEVEISIEVTKEILKATYQMGDLVARLKSFKRKGD